MVHVEDTSDEHWEDATDEQQGYHDSSISLSTVFVNMYNCKIINFIYRFICRFIDKLVNI